jgi:pimeloyl-ACP methyl ester carboxylesterase
VADINGLDMHVLEAGFESGERPAVLLLHGFPELAWSWRAVMPRLAAAGFHVVAPDQRGYGRTTGWDPDYDGDLVQFRPLNLVRDALGLILAMGLGPVSVVGHDFGSPVAAWCGMVRPDVFTRVALMSAPFAGAPDIQDGSGVRRTGRADVLADLARLPRPRMHYQQYYTTREANGDLWHATQGVHDFLRAYYHHKSADWLGNTPHVLSGFSAEALAEMPTYYVMDAGKSMAETVAEHMPGPDDIRANRWLPDDALAVYAREYERTGFQGGLNWYRAAGASTAEQQLFSGRTLDQPVMFIAGASDWGIYQSPGAFERMQGAACADFRGAFLIEGAGHWVQQEQPEETARLLIEFLNS